MKWCMFLFLFFSLVAHGQENLVPNGGFERYDHCPVNAPSQIEYLINHWYTLLQTPDYFHFCGGNGHNIPDTKNGHILPFYSACIGLVLWYKVSFAREFVGIRLSDSLVQGSKYRFTCWVQPGDSTRYAVKNFGAFFVQDSIQALSPGLLDYLTSQQAQVEYSGNAFIQNREEWVEVSGEFIADGGENFMALGNFDADEETDTFYMGGSTQSSEAFDLAYVYIDNVSLVEDSTTSISEPETFKTYVYPNPARNALYVSITGTEETMQFEMWTTVGQRLKQEWLQSGINTISTDNLPVGVYYYVVTLNNERKHSGKLVIIR